MKKARTANEWSGCPDPSDPDNFYIDDATGERVNAHTGERTPRNIKHPGTSMTLATTRNFEPAYPLHVERGSIDDEPEGVDPNKHVSTWAVVDDDGNWVAKGIPTRALAEQFAAAPELLAPLGRLETAARRLVEGHDTSKDYVLKMASIARAAIAKAQGRA